MNTGNSRTVPGSYRAQQGATLVEYTLIAGIIILGILIAQLAVLSGLRRFYDRTGDSLDYTRKERLVPSIPTAI